MLVISISPDSNKIRDVCTLRGCCYEPGMDAGLEALDQLLPIFYGDDPAAENFMSTVVVLEEMGM